MERAGNTYLKRLKRTVLTAALLLWGGQGVFAQNNNYLMNDALYPRYLKAYKLRKTKEGVRMADSIIHDARRIGDYHGELTAMTVPFLYEFYQPDNEPRVKMKAMELMEKSASHNMWFYYYFTVSNYANYLIGSDKFVEAIVFTTAQKHFAEEKHHNVGMRDCYYILGTVHEYRGEFSSAIEQFQQYIDFSRKHTRNSDLTDAHLNICACYRKSNNFTDMLKAADEAWKDCKIPDDYFDVKVQQAYAHFMLGQYNAFRDDYQYLEEHKNDNRGLREVLIEALKICKDIMDGKEQKAKKAIDEFIDGEHTEGLRLAIAYYKYKGDYLNVIRYQWMLAQDYSQKIKDALVKDDRSAENITHAADKEKKRQNLELSNTRLALSNTQLGIENSNLELNHKRDAARIAFLSADRKKLDAEQQQLAAAKLKKTLKMKQEKAKDEQIRERMRRSYIMAYTIIALIILTMTIVYMMIRRRQSERMRQQIGEIRDRIHTLNEAKEEAGESDMLKTRFVQNMSHEIRTPLNAIVGFSNVLVQMGNELDEKDSNELTHHIEANANLLTTLVNDIIDLAGMQSHSYQMSYETVRLNDLCRETIETVRHRAAEGVELRFETEINDDFTAETDRKRVAQVLINLLTNAEKNTQKGSITLNCKMAAQPYMVTFTVTDTGVGIPKEKMDEIFQRFCKLDPTKQGTGLGLDICRTIANKLQGEINIDRNYTDGARFYFTIPFRS